MAKRINKISIKENKMKKNLVNGLIIISVMVMFGISANAQSVSGYKSVATIDKRFINSALTSKPAVDNCIGKQLSLKEVDSEGDMGGKVYAKFVFTNISSSTCMISGFPNLILLDKSGKVMRVRFERDNDKPSLVSLKPTQTAWFTLLYNNGFGYDIKKSPPSSAQIKVTIPKISQAFTIKSKLAPYKRIVIYTIKNGLPD